MLFPTKTISLKDGRRAVLRSPTAADAPVMLDYLRKTAGETEFLLRCPEECTMTVEMEERFIQSVNESERDVMVVCEVDGELTGNCSLSCMNRIKTRHRGEVAIALLQKWWGLGIGAAMLQELIDLARSHGLMQLELEFFEGNNRARALYEKLGFRIVGMRPNAARFRDGSMHHDYIMVKELEICP